MKDYDSSKFEKLSMTTDILIFSVLDGFHENYRKLNKKLLDLAFRRIIANKVEKTNKMKTGGKPRPAIIFKYRGSDENDKN